MKPTCPACGHPDVQLVRVNEASEGFFGSPSIVSTSTYQCQCGATFTHADSAPATPAQLSLNAEQGVANRRTILQSMTAEEVSVEYARVMTTPPPDNATKATLIDAMVKKLEDDSAGR